MRSSGMQASVKPWWYLFPVVYTRWHWTRHLWSLDQHSEWNGGKKEKNRKRKVSEIGFSIQPWFRCKDKPRKKQPHGILPFKGLKKESFLHSLKPFGSFSDVLWISERAIFKEHFLCYCSTLSSYGHSVDWVLETVTKIYACIFC